MVIGGSNTVPCLHTPCSIIFTIKNLVWRLNSNNQQIGCFNHISGAKNKAAIKKRLTVRLKALKSLIPWGVLRLPAETYFEKPGQLTNNEHKALMQVKSQHSESVWAGAVHEKLRGHSRLRSRFLKFWCRAGINPTWHP